MLLCLFYLEGRENFAFMALIRFAAASMACAIWAEYGEVNLGAGGEVKAVPATLADSASLKVEVGSGARP